MITIRGIEFDISFMDADVVERHEDAARKMQVAVSDKAKFKRMKTADAIREQCRIMEEYIDVTLDCDSANEFFRGKYDIMEHFQVCDEINLRFEESKKALSDITNKYVHKQQAVRPNDFNGHTHKNNGNRGKGGRN